MSGPFLFASFSLLLPALGRPGNYDSILDLVSLELHELLC